MQRLFDPAHNDRTACDAEFHACNFAPMALSASGTVAGLFAGIGGIELGLQRAGMHAELLCESWDPARAVLESRFANVPVVGDVRELEKLPLSISYRPAFPVPTFPRQVERRESQAKRRGSSVRSSVCWMIGECRG